MPDLTNITDTLPDGSTVTSLVADHDHGGLDFSERWGNTHDTWHEESSSQPPDPPDPPDPPQAYLDVAIARASTPDPGVFPAQCCILYRGRHIPGGDVLHTVASQFEPAGQEQWMLQRLSRNGNVTTTTTDGTIYGTHESPIGPMDDQDVKAAGAWDLPKTDATRFRAWLHDGVWKPQPYSPVTANLPAVKDGTGPLRIGSFNANTQPFMGRIYWVECRTGLDPTAGTVLWRFDAADWVSGTSWTDPRGHTWTLTAAGAIKPPD